MCNLCHDCLQALKKIYISLSYFQKEIKTYDSPLHPVCDLSAFLCQACLGVFIIRFVTMRQRTAGNPSARREWKNSLTWKAQMSSCCAPQRNNSNIH